MEYIEVKILLKYTPKRTKLHKLKNLSWEHGPNPPSKLRGMQLPNLKNGSLPPPYKTCIRLWFMSNKQYYLLT